MTGRRLIGVAGILAILLVPALRGDTAPLPAVHAQDGAGRVFVARHSMTSGIGIVYELTSGAAVEFARVRTAGWIGALAASPDGKLFVVTGAEDGSLWDVTNGGDLTRAQPQVRGLFAQSLRLTDTVRGLTFDGDGNAYILYRKDFGESPIVRVTPAGAVSELSLRFEDPRGLLAHQGVLYVADRDTGTVLAYDLAGGELREFATGLGRSKAQGVQQVQLPEPAVNADGRLLVLWETVQPGALVTFCCNRPALYDISDGGDFSDIRGGLVVAPRGSGGAGPDGPSAFDGANNLYAASRADDGTVYVSRFVAGAYAPFEPLAEIPGSRVDRITGLAVLR